MIRVFASDKDTHERRLRDECCDSLSEYTLFGQFLFPTMKGCQNPSLVRTTSILFLLLS